MKKCKMQKRQRTTYLRFFFKIKLTILFLLYCVVAISLITNFFYPGTLIFIVSFPIIPLCILGALISLQAFVLYIKATQNTYPKQLFTKSMLATWGFGLCWFIYFLAFTLDSDSSFYWTGWIWTIILSFTIPFLETIYFLKRKNLFEFCFDNDIIDITKGNGKMINYIPFELSYEDIIKKENYEEPDFDYVMIKTTHSMVAERGSLYESTRKYWRASERITNYSIVVSVIDQIVQEVYIADSWHQFTDGEYPGRWEFFGTVSPNEAHREIIGKRIPEKYRQKGITNPVLYKR